jgi:hypothetical protein
MLAASFATKSSEYSYEKGASGEFVSHGLPISRFEEKFAPVVVFAASLLFLPVGARLCSTGGAGADPNPARDKTRD